MTHDIFHAIIISHAGISFVKFLFKEIVEEIILLESLEVSTVIFEVKSFSCESCEINFNQSNFLERM